MSKKKDATLYEILDVPENCTSQQIRNSFVNLSKSFHPDMNPEDSELHSKFVKINEAYTVLSKPDSRKNYDLSLRNFRNYGFHSNHAFSSHAYRDLKVKTTAPNYKVYDGSFWEHRDKSRDGPIDDMNYYGIKGIKKKSNGVVALGCVMLMGIGILVHYAYVRTKVKYNLALLDEKDQRLGVRLYNARKAAIQNGNTRQLEILQYHAENNSTEELFTDNQNQR